MILIIGDVMLDIYYWCDVNRISPEAPVPIVKIKGMTHNLGGAGNVYNNLKSLRKDVILFYDKTKQIYKCRYFSKGQQMFRIDKENTEDSTYSSKQLKQLNEYCQKAEWIILSDYGKGTITKEVVNIIINYPNKLIVDPSVRNQQLIKYLNFKRIIPFLIKPNEKEIVELTGINDVVKAGVELSQYYKNVLITRGKRGCTLINEKGIKHYKTKEIDVANVIGAGDTFIAVFTHYLNKGFDKAIKMANKSANKAISQLGTYTIQKDDL